MAMPVWSRYFLNISACFLFLLASSFTFVDDGLPILTDPVGSFWDFLESVEILVLPIWTKRAEGFWWVRLFWVIISLSPLYARLCPRGAPSVACE